jgi:hypothetical protein
MDGATDLSELLGNAPVQSPSFAPMVTGGGDPFIAPVVNNHKPAATLQSNSHMFYTAKMAVKNFMVYLGFFLATILVSLSTPRSLILQYIPNTFNSSGSPTYMGAAILGGVAVFLAYIIGTLGSALF